jgi:glutamine phosphoribosylpyrophosphate amidotransferase
MCAIIGVNSVDAELTPMVMKEFLVQSQIRGKHATGISYVDNGKIKTISKPIPARQFVKQDLPISKLMIGHCRYSTSDIQYNQPISDSEMSVVHNGIITQESPEQWTKHFGYDNFQTKNDTELLFKCLKKKDDPFVKFPQSSIAAAVLRKDRIEITRNNTRPLWMFCGNYVTGFASTEDIIFRSLDALGFDRTEFLIINATPFCTETLMEDDMAIHRTGASLIFLHHQKDC